MEKAVKGFNQDMTCRGFQYKEGENYEMPEAKLCESGAHACKNPLDCFGYYPPGNSVFHEVELDDVSDEKGDDSKVCAKKNQDRRKTQREADLRPALRICKRAHHKRRARERQ